MTGNDTSQATHIASYCCSFDQNGQILLKWTTDLSVMISGRLNELVTGSYTEISKEGLGCHVKYWNPTHSGHESQP